MVFETYETMEFEDWSQGVLATLVKDEVGFGIKSSTTFLAFSDVPNRPGFLIFDQTKIGLGLPKLDLFMASGKLSMERPKPSDMIDLANYPDIIPTQKTSESNAGLLLTFPTGKASLNDLTQGERKELTDFVTSTARAIAELSDLYKVSTPRP